MGKLSILLLIFLLSSAIFFIGIFIHYTIQIIVFFSLLNQNEYPKYTFKSINIKYFISLFGLINILTYLIFLILSKPLLDLQQDITNYGLLDLISPLISIIIMVLPQLIPSLKKEIPYKILKTSPSKKGIDELFSSLQFLFSQTSKDIEPDLIQFLYTCNITSYHYIFSIISIVIIKNPELEKKLCESLSDFLRSNYRKLIFTEWKNFITALFKHNFPVKYFLTFLRQIRDEIIVINNENSNEIKISLIEIILNELFKSLRHPSISTEIKIDITNYYFEFFDRYTTDSFEKIFITFCNFFFDYFDELFQYVPENKDKRASISRRIMFFAEKMNENQNTKQFSKPLLDKAFEIRSLHNE